MTSPSEPWRLSLAGAARLIERRELSPVELIESYLARIEQVDPIVNSYITVMASSARDAARRAEAEIRRGQYLGRLHGIPVALKDIIDTAGVRTTAGSRRFLDRVPAADAVVVSRLRAAGAIVLGKLMLYEFALGPPREGDIFPPARNVWNLAHGAGGSSSGSSAAVAARLCAAALGSDAAGSIRRPAAESGVVGVNPTHGLVSLRGVLTHCWTLDQIGPLARSVEDAATVLEAIEDRDGASRNMSAYGDAMALGVQGLRAAVPWSFIRGVPSLKPDVLDAFKAAVGVFERLGAEIVDVSLPASVSESMTMLDTILAGEVRAYHASEIEAGAQSYGLAMRERLMLGAFYDASDYVQAQRARGRLASELSELMRRADVLLMPTMPHTSPALADETRPDGTLRHVQYTHLFNLSGQPSISVPCGFDSAGLPIGLMVAAPHFDERTMFRAAYAYEQATAAERRPYPDLVKA